MVHTDANSISYVPLAAPHRILDTRSSAMRASVLDPTGKFDSTGRLLANMTIHIDLTSLVSFADGVTANLTVTGPAASGWALLWSGAVARPAAASSINFTPGQTIANLTSSGVFPFGTSTDTIAIFTTATTHVILDVAAFAVFDIRLVKVQITSATMSGSVRAQRLRQAFAKLQK